MDFHLSKLQKSTFVTAAPADSNGKLLSYSVPVSWGRQRGTQTKARLASWRQKEQRQGQKNRYRERGQRASLTPGASHRERGAGKAGRPAGPPYLPRLHKIALIRNHVAVAIQRERVLARLW